jgi:hypothetical protein
MLFTSTKWKSRFGFGDPVINEEKAMKLARNQRDTHLAVNGRFWL